MKVLAGGGTDDSVGFFVQPTLLQVEDPAYRLMCEEIFGPVLTVLCVSGGAVAGDSDPGRPDQPLRADRRGVRPGPASPRRGRPGAPLCGGQLLHQRQADRGGGGAAAIRRSRASGTNDKAGSVLNLLRWVSPRSIKETLSPPKDYRYPYHGSGVDLVERQPVALLAFVRPPLVRSGLPAQDGFGPVRYSATAARLRPVPGGLRIRDSDPDRGAWPGADSGRRGVWQFRASAAADDVELEGWLDSLALWRRSPETTIRPDTDGLLGGRYRGGLTREGRYRSRVRPFVPDEVAEVAGMATALDDFFPPLPPRATPRRRGCGAIRRASRSSG